MNGITLQELRDRVRWRSDTQGDTRRFPDTELDACINDGIKAFHAELVRADGMGIQEAEYVFNTADGTTDYALPASFLHIKAITIRNGGWVRTLRTYSELDLPMLMSTDIWSNSCTLVGYRLMGDNIRILPMPRGVFPITIKYVQTAIKLTSPSSVLDGYDGLEEYVICWAAEAFCIKNNEQDRVAVLQGRRAEARDRIMALIVNRIEAEPPQVEDGAGYRDRPYAWGPYRGMRY
jgi:hypothetical protein